MVVAPVKICNTEKKNEKEVALICPSRMVPQEFLTEGSGCSLPEAAATKVAKNTTPGFLVATGRIRFTGTFTGSVNHAVLDGSSSEVTSEMIRKSSRSSNNAHVSVICCHFKRRLFPTLMIQTSTVFLCSLHAGGGAVADELSSGSFQGKHVKCRNRQLRTLNWSRPQFMF